MTSTSQMPDPIGFIGLGVMGSGMCRNVVSKYTGPVHVYDMAADAIAAQVAAGAVAAASVAEVAASAQVILLSLPGGKQVAEVCDAIAAHAQTGTIIIDLSTTAVAEARAVGASLAAKGIAFIDAPVARTREAAQAGTLSIMVGSSTDEFARIAPLLGLMGSDVTHCGALGCGQVVKLINNALLFEQVAALAEMMVAGERAGVAPEVLLKAVSLGSGDSFALRNHGLKAMVPRNFPEKSFPPEYALKDLGYAIELARGSGVSPRMTELAADYYRSAVEQGLGGRYFPVVIEVIDREGQP